jgi:GntR family transcriptional regulator
MARYEIEVAHLRRMIESGEYAVGTTLPRIADLTAERGVSSATIRRALDVLEEEGLVRVVRGTGAIVQPPAPARRRIQRGVRVERDPSRGYVFPAAAHAGEPWEVHGRPRASMEPAPAPVADVLQVGTGTPTLRRRRVTSPVGEPPFQLVDTWLSSQAVADAPRVAEPSTGPGGYLDRLEEAGHGPVSWVETTRARMPTTEEARLLRISSQLPVLELTLVGRSGRTGEVLEATVRVIPADRVEMVATLERAESAQWPVRPVSP